MPRGWARALAIALLLPCFAAVYDGVLLLTAWQRLHRAAASLADSLAATATPVESDFPALFAEARVAAQPDDVTRLGGIVVSAIRCGDGQGAVLWQRRAGADIASRYGTAGDAIPMREGLGTLIAAELTAPISPWVLGGPWLQRALPDLLHVSALRRAA